MEVGPWPSGERSGISLFVFGRRSVGKDKEQGLELVVGVGPARTGRYTYWGRDCGGKTGTHNSIHAPRLSKAEDAGERHLLLNVNMF